MQTKLIQGTAPRADDKAIKALIKAETDPYGGGPGTMVVGIRNDAGQLYRTIETSGMGEYMRVIASLQALGLRDEVASGERMRESCDSIFAG